MKPVIIGRGIDLGSSFRDFIESTLNNDIVTKFDKIVSGIKVVIYKQHNNFCAEIIANEGVVSTEFVKTLEYDGDPHAAYKKALKIFKFKLRKYKNRLFKKRNDVIVNKDNSSFPVKSVDARSYLFNSEDQDVDESSVDDVPLIVAEDSSKIEVITVAEAAMKMECSCLPALLFINIKTGRLNMVYQRQDKHIAWVDPGI